MIEGTVSLKCSRCNHCEVCQWVDLKMNGCDWFEEEPRTGWIPVSKRLPEKNMECLVAVGKFNLTQMAMYSDLMGIKNHRIFYQGNFGDDSFEDITQYVNAWMPLPEPYKASPTEAESEE